METLRPKAAATVLAIKLEKPGKLKWRAGHYLVIDGNVPRTMKPAELEAEYEHADDAGVPAAPVAAPVRHPRRASGRPGRKAAKPAREKSTSPAKPIATVPAKPGRRSSFSAEQMAEARRLIEAGKSITETATELALPYRTVWGWSKANGWETK